MKSTESDIPGIETLSILIAEDHPLMAKISSLIIKKMYPHVVIAETDNVHDLMELCKKNKYHLIILDSRLKDGNTFPMISTIKSMLPETRLLYFTMYAEEIYGKRILNYGADGFLNKHAYEAEFKEAVTTVLHGSRYMSQELQRQMADEVLDKKGANPFDQLSEREFEVMMLLLQGRQLMDISNELSIHVSTVGTHKTRLFEKLHVSSLMELNKVAVAYEIVF